MAADQAELLQQQIDRALVSGAPLTIAPGTYTITRTLRIVPPSGSQHRLNIDARGVRLVWAGPGDSTAIYCKGWKYATVQGLEVVTSGTNVTAWDLDTPDDAPSLSGVVFQNCRVVMGGMGNVGWRGAVNGNLYGDVSALIFQGCVADGNSVAKGNIGWQALRYNCISWTWQGGGALRCAKVFSNLNPAPGAAQHGGASMSFYGFSPSGNGLDFEFRTGGAYLISGGRYELGKCLLRAGANGDRYGVQVRFEGVNISTYTPDDGIVFDLRTAATLTLADCTVNRWAGADYDSRLITAAAAGHGAIRIAGGGIQAPSPCYTIDKGQWRVAIDGVSQFANNTAVLGWLT